MDSSVAAALLKKQGYDVIGIFMKLWAEDAASTDFVRENICCSLEAATAARMVAQKLDIPFYVVNFADEFKKTVVDNYIKEYDSGRTPNPCVICNRDIKGEILFKKMQDLGGDYLATGHYARLKFDGKNYHLYRAKDDKKDQTYFLWTLSQKKLAKLLFPVGVYNKAQIRQLATKFNLPTAQRKESQGICFIPDRDICGFLRRYATKLTKPGDILDTQGHKLGLHDGLINYTIGQRERLGLGGPKAYFVVKLDSKKNRLIVGNSNELYSRTLTASSLNWINPVKGKLGGRIRYGHPIESCKISPKDEKSIEVVFDQAQRAITSGQSIVFYSGEELLGGGIIN